MADLDEDYPRLGEIGRTLKDFREEFRNSISQLVRRDVYEAEQRHLRERVTKLESDWETAEKTRETEQKAALTSMRSMRRQIVVGVISALVPALLAAGVVLLRILAH